MGSPEKDLVVTFVLHTFAALGGGSGGEDRSGDASLTRFGGGGVDRSGDGSVTRSGGGGGVDWIN